MSQRGTQQADSTGESMRGATRIVDVRNGVAIAGHDHQRTVTHGGLDLGP
jgi:hypothetical protein